MKTTQKSNTQQAEILREYSPYPGMEQIHGVTFDGARVWFARGEGLVALDPESGNPSADHGGGCGRIVSMKTINHYTNNI